jgi:DNA-binding PadR family transcriptional regulator
MSPPEAQSSGGDLYYRSAILVLLTEQAGHGEDLLGRLADLGFEARTASTLHRVLRDMEEEGLVGSTWEIDEDGEPPRQVRVLTAKGAAQLGEMAPVIFRQRYAFGVLLDRYRALSRRQCRSSTSSGHRKSS